MQREKLHPTYPSIDLITPLDTTDVKIPSSPSLCSRIGVGAHEFLPESRMHEHLLQHESTVKETRGFPHQWYQGVR